MGIGSPTVESTQALVFGGDEGDEEELLNTINFGGGEGERRQSMYVKLFEEMMRVVLYSESHLFSRSELLCIQRYIALTSPAKYLLVRLCLRKSDKWHRLSSLKYESEMGEAILPALEELCGTSKRLTHAKIKEEQPDIIDLTSDGEDTDEVRIPVAGLSRLPEPRQLPNVSIYDTFADDSSEASLKELLDCLSLPELKNIAGSMKMKSTTTRASIIECLLDTSVKQGTIPFRVISPIRALGKGKGKGTTFRQTQLQFKSSQTIRTQQDRLRDIVLKTLVQCVRVNENVVKLFRRLNLVYFRHTEYTPALITPSILVESKKRSYPAYNYTRTSTIWPNRDSLIQYEEALELSAQMEEIMGGAGTFSRGRSRSVASKTRSSVRRSTTISPSKSLGGILKAKVQDELPGETMVEEKPRVAAARAAKQLLEKVYPKWRDLLDTKTEEGRSGALDRFDCGYVLTRVICKGASALGILGDYRKELELLEILLAQKRWRRGRRGRWYERRALILHKHMGQDKIILNQSMKVVIEGLQDDDTHMVYRVALERRLTRLENKLAIPPEDRHRCEARLKQAEKVFITGVRIEHSSTSLVLDSNLKVVNKPVLFTQHIDKFIQGGSENADPPAIAAPVKTEKPTGKSVWKGRYDEEINVETLALQHYEDLGYKGFHCEGRIVTTLFGLLFWDILFASVPGAFETPYQSAPLDIAEDTFSISRQDIIDTRLREIEEGDAVAIVERIYDAHSERKVMCVGVRWDMFERQDLIEITKCIGGLGLSAICRLFCEDYASRCSGIPDLIIWNAELEECKFVEVKGPGDNLQENQKVWIDVLLRAGVTVQVCHVGEEGKQTTSKGKKTPKGKGKSAVSPRKRKRGSDDQEGTDLSNHLESEDEDDVPLAKRARKLKDDVSDVLPHLPPSELITVVRSKSITSTRTSSTTLASFPESPRMLRRSWSRTDSIIGSTVATPSKKPRIAAPSSP